MTDPTDLAALADRLNAAASNTITTTYIRSEDAAAAARILRAVAAAPGPLREVAEQLRANWEFATGQRPSVQMDVPDATIRAVETLTALADAVGEP